MYEIFEKLMKERGLRVADVCKATGLSQSMMSDWKRGKYAPKADKMQKIADYFGVPLEMFTSKAKPRKTVVVKIPRIPFDNSKYVEKIQEIIKDEAVNLALEILNKEFPKRLQEAMDNLGLKITAYFTGFPCRFAESVLKARLNLIAVKQIPSVWYSSNP